MKESVTDAVRDFIGGDGFEQNIFQQKSDVIHAPVYECSIIFLSHICLACHLGWTENML